MFQQQNSNIKRIIMASVVGPKLVKGYVGNGVTKNGIEATVCLKESHENRLEVLNFNPGPAKIPPAVSCI